MQAARVRSFVGSSVSSVRNLVKNNEMREASPSAVTRRRFVRLGNCNRPINDRGSVESNLCPKIDRRARDAMMGFLLKS